MSQNTVQFETQTDVVFAGADEVVRNLRKKFAKSVREHSNVNTWLTGGWLLLDWLIIFSSVIICEKWPSPWLYALAVLIIAGRQHAFLIIVHEAVHYRVSTKIWLNDLISDVFAAMPILFDTEMYRQSHSKHHRYLNTDQDPDWIRKHDHPSWQFPVGLKKILTTGPWFMLCGGAIEWLNFATFFSGLRPFQTLHTKKQLLQVTKRVLFFAAVSGLLTYFHAWKLFAIYWLVPFLFIFPTFQRIRSIAEHFGLSRTHELNSTRNVIAPWYEAMLLGPHGVNYHLTHHFFPSVPFFRLKSLNDLLMTDAGYRRLAHQNQSYLLPSSHSVLQDLTKTLINDENFVYRSDPESDDETSSRSLRRVAVPGNLLRQ